MNLKLKTWHKVSKGLLLGGIILGGIALLYGYLNDLPMSTNYAAIAGFVAVIISEAVRNSVIARLVDQQTNNARL